MIETSRLLGIAKPVDLLEAERAAHSRARRELRREGRGALLQRGDRAQLLGFAPGLHVGGVQVREALPR